MVVNLEMELNITISNCCMYVGRKRVSRNCESGKAAFVVKPPIPWQP